MPAFESVEPVLAETEGTCASGGPGVDHTHLKEVEFFGCAGEPAASVVDVKLEIGDRSDVGECLMGGLFGEEVDEDGIQLDAGDIGYAEEMSGHDVSTAANADDCGFFDSRETIGEGDDVVFEEGDGVRCAVVVKRCSAGAAVDVELHKIDVHVLWQERRRTPELRSTAEGAGGEDAGVGVPLLVGTPGVSFEVGFYEHGANADGGEGVEESEDGKCDGDGYGAAPPRSGFQAGLLFWSAAGSEGDCSERADDT